MEVCVKIVLQMNEKKMFLPESTTNFIIEKLIESRHYEQSLLILSRLADHGRIEKLCHKDILKNFLLYDQSEFALQFLRLLPLGVFLNFFFVGLIITPRTHRPSTYGKITLNIVVPKTKSKKLEKT